MIILFDREKKKYYRDDLGEELDKGEVEQYWTEDIDKATVFESEEELQEEIKYQMSLRQYFNTFKNTSMKNILKLTPLNY